MEEQDVAVEEEVTTDDYANDSESEAEAEDGSEDNGTDSDRTYTKAELEEQLKERDKRWKDRLKDSKKSAKESVKKEEVDADERYERLNLKTEGITDKKEQDIILDIASYKGVDAIEAMKLPAVKAELAEYRAKASVPAPSSRTNGGVNNSIEHVASQIRKGTLRLADITDPEVKRQLKTMKVFG